MAATSAKPKPAASVTHASDLVRVERIGDVFEPFGWKSKNPSNRLTDADAADVDAWLEDCEFDRMGTVNTPEVIWRFVEMPSRVLKHFPEENDATALAAALMPDSGKYFEWLAEQAAPSDFGAAGSLADLPSETSTIAGTVFAELKGDVSTLWFGRKANQEPALSGSAAVEAVNSLFNLAIRGEQPASQPANEPAANAKGKRTKAVTKDAEPTESAAYLRSELRYIPLKNIQPAKENHRKTFDKAALTELADSIKAHGVLQPLLLRPLNSGPTPIFVIIAGERRYRAALQAGLQDVPAQIVEREGVSESLAMLHENIMRVDLNPIERAQAIRRLMDEHSLSQKEVGQMVGCGQGQISNELRLLNLPESLQAMVAAGQIAPTLIRVVLPVAEYSAVMEEIVQSIDKCIEEKEPIDEDALKMAMREAVMKHSRPMRLEATWQPYSAPNPKARHFGKITPDQEKQLAAQELSFLNHWESPRRTFNIELFDQLNKAPLAARREKHRKYKEERGSSCGSKEKKAAAKPFESEWQVRQCVEYSLSPLLADVLESCKDSQKVRAVCMTLCVLADGGLQEAFAGKQVNQESVIPNLLRSFSLKESDKLIRETLVGELRRDFYMRSSEFIDLGKFLGVNLLQLWKPTDELLQVLTDHGRELVAAAAGAVPEFLLPFFGIEPKKPAKAKKAKAA